MRKDKVVTDNKAERFEHDAKPTGCTYYRVRQRNNQGAGAELSEPQGAQSQQYAKTGRATCGSCTSCQKEQQEPTGCGRHGVSWAPARSKKFKNFKTGYGLQGICHGTSRFPQSTPWQMAEE